MASSASWRVAPPLFSKVRRTPLRSALSIRSTGLPAAVAAVSAFPVFLGDPVF